MTVVALVALPTNPRAAAPAKSGERVAERYPETVSPPRKALIPFNRREVPAGTEPDPQALARDPELLAAWLEQHPEKLDATKMDAALLSTVAQLLLTSERVFDAERLLFQGLKRWPDNVDLARRWTAIVSRLNRTEAAREVLERVAPVAGDAGLYYALGIAYIRREPRNEADLRAALAAWERTVALDPEFKDADGTTAEQIRNALVKLRKDLPAEPAPVAPPPPAPPSAVAPR